ncbi:MAG: carbamoyltransferase HypF [Campylobacterales bacterium]
MLRRVKLLIRGVVQGVGFRPFVYNLANELELKGFVLNNSSGVLVDIEGKSENLKLFMEKLQSQKPKNSIIESVEQECDCEPLHRKEFIIKDSIEESDRCALMPTDKAICPECLKELKDSSNRRYNYPFINCIDYGPRYTIIKKLPYDRVNTSMDSFTMCHECQEEYHNPLDRRFHAQPNSCSKCGPKLTLLRNNGTALIEGEKSIEITAKMIKKGEIVAIKGMGGFHLVCDASKANVVQKLRDKKKRPTKPFAVMFKSFADIMKCSSIQECEAELINSSERPIVLVEKKKPHRLEKFCIASELIAPNNTKMGVFLPYTPIHILLLEKLNTPIVCTSANISDESIIADSKGVLEKLQDVATYVLDYDRKIINPCDDSVVDVFDGEVKMVRRARGYAPANIKLPIKSTKKILALGANQKNTIAIGFEDNTLISPHIGDIDNLDTYSYFEQNVRLFGSVYDFTPEVVVCDAHPEYASTKYAKTLGKEILQVYHHHAHTLSVLAENGALETKVLGVSWDGSGYGEDGTIWGGEFLEVDGVECKRIGHFRKFKLLGGNRAIKEPRRSALGLLYEIYGDEAFSLGLPFLKSFKEDELEALQKMCKSDINSTQTSSVGRLFDAIAAILEVLYISSYEGEAGVCLEYEAASECDEVYGFELKDGVIDTKQIVEGVIADRGDVPKAAAKFMNTLASIAVAIAKNRGLPMALSGGVFLNGYLLKAIKKEANKEGVEYLINKRVPSGDGGISLGQIAYAALKYK